VYTGEKSLRMLVNKWFGVDSVARVRVMEFGRTISDRRRYVRIGTWRHGGYLTIVFFRHDDKSWNVFPSKVGMPAMQAYRKVA
jgi:hypothetical protein